MIRIIVTGGLGFIGSNLIDLLLKKKFNVLNIDKKTYSSNIYNTKSFEKNSNYNFVKCDLNNSSKLNKIILIKVKVTAWRIMNLQKVFKNRTKKRKPI